MTRFTVDPKERTEYWVVTFNVSAPPDYKETDIIVAVEHALDDGEPLSKNLDATFITAHVVREVSRRPSHAG